MMTRNVTSMGFMVTRLSPVGSSGGTVACANVFAEMLLRYDVSFAENGDMGLGPEKRPKSMHLLELGFTDPSAKVYIRERTEAKK